MRLIGMEFFKCRRRQVPLICLALIAAQLLWMGVVHLPDGAGGDERWVDCSCCTP